MFIKNKTKNAKRLKIKMKAVGDFLYVKIFSVLYFKSNSTNNIFMYMQKCGLVYLWTFGWHINTTHYSLLRPKAS